MDNGYKEALLEKLRELSISELLSVLLNEDKPENKKLFKNFIEENFQENPQLEYEKAVKEISQFKYPSFTKERLLISKQCVRDIKEHLEIEHVNSLAKIACVK